ncbi:MAG TPA: cobalamin-independent methionine synthase II family protein [Planctomycetota bacterium]|nr:cobalamin-independent methionine synthase II family protein [Planctomycetota bacterium]
MANEPAIRTTVVGSYPVPAWLAAMPSTPTLRDAILVVVRTQELAGIDVVSDGELSRFDVDHPETNGMIEYFVEPLEGVSKTFTRTEIEQFRALPGMKFRTQPAGVVRGPLDEGILNLPAAFQLLRSLATRPTKFTVTSPYMLAKTLLDRYYEGDRRKLTMALADVLRKQIEGIDASVIQVDEANLPGSPADGPWAAEAINHVLKGARGRKGVHLCFGNYGGQSIQKGAYRELLPFFNALDCDHLVLEFARRGYDELEAFKDLKPSIALGVGVIDIKDNEVEAPSAVAAAIETSVKALGADRIRWIHPDCGFWMLTRSVADRKMRAMVEGRDLFLGRRI